MLLNHTAVLWNTKRPGETKASMLITSSFSHTRRTKRSTQVTPPNTPQISPRRGDDRKWNMHRDSSLATRFLNFTRPAGNSTQAQALINLSGFSKQTYPTSQCPHLCTSMVSHTNYLGLFLEVSIVDFCAKAPHTVWTHFYTFTLWGNLIACLWQRSVIKEKSPLTYISPDLPCLFSLLYCFFIILQITLHEEAHQS